MELDATSMEVSLGSGVVVGTQTPPQRATTPNFRPMSVVAKQLDGWRCHLVWR